MKYDRVADIPVSHLFSDYVCTIGYSEYEEEFHCIGVRYADPSDARKPKDEFSIYSRVLKEPALRACLFSALLPEEQGKILELREQALDERAKNIGFSAGFAALCILGYALYRLTAILARFLGHEWAELLIYLPSFFAFLIIFPVQHFVRRWYKRRYCIQHGHRLEQHANSSGTQVARRKRCGLYIGPLTHLSNSSSGEP